MYIYCTCNHTQQTMLSLSQWLLHSMSVGHPFGPWYCKLIWQDDLVNFSLFLGCNCYRIVSNTVQIALALCVLPMEKIIAEWGGRLCEVILKGISLHIKRDVFWFALFRCGYISTTSVIASKAWQCITGNSFDRCHEQRGFIINMTPRNELMKNLSNFGRLVDNISMKLSLSMPLPHECRVIA